MVALSPEKTAHVDGEGVVGRGDPLSGNGGQGLELGRDLVQDPLKLLYRLRDDILAEEEVADTDDQPGQKDRQEEMRAMLTPAARSTVISESRPSRLTASEAATAIATGMVM